jgi:hypothetical protein
VCLKTRSDGSQPGLWVSLAHVASPMTADYASFRPGHRQGGAVPAAEGPFPAGAVPHGGTRDGDEPVSKSEA